MQLYCSFQYKSYYVINTKLWFKPNQTFQIETTKNEKKRENDNCSGWINKIQLFDENHTNYSSFLSDFPTLLMLLTRT